jgi:hypothetical protein
VKVAPSGALRIDTSIVLPSIVNVADVPEVLTVAFVCIRHITLALAVISSWRSTCFRPFNKRIPRFTDVLRGSNVNKNEDERC